MLFKSVKKIRWDSYKCNFEKLSKSLKFIKIIFK
jgi:hypothetical protein